MHRGADRLPHVKFADLLVFRFELVKGYKHVKGDESPHLQRQAVAELFQRGGAARLVVVEIEVRVVIQCSGEDFPHLQSLAFDGLCHAPHHESLL